jgi:hypothetical protein
MGRLPEDLAIFRFRRSAGLAPMLFSFGAPNNACISRLKFSKAAGPVTMILGFVRNWLLVRVHCTPDTKFEASI